MGERLKNIILYGDTDRENYHLIQRKIEESNRFSAMIFSSVGAFLVFIMFILSFLQEGFSSSKTVYIFGVIFSLLLVLIAYFSKNIPALTYVSVYLALSVFMIYGIAIGTLTRPEEQTVTFMVMMIFVPLIFVDRPIRMAAGLIFYITLFIIMAYRTKSGAVLSVDISDAIIFGLLAIISETVIYRVKIKGFVLENKLRIMSETDQLTGLNNRNCYEMCIDTYSLSYDRSFCCIYIDVNGLHELNNTQGHKAGDEMLCYIADAVRKQFGRKDSYRIGGDEYVAFTIDISLDDVKNRIEVMKEQIAAKGYHAAIGYEFCETKNINVNELIVRAETKMYKDKAEYYSQHGRMVR